jgi:Flp pilus assembly protein TadD
MIVRNSGVGFTTGQKTRVITFALLTAWILGVLGALPTPASSPNEQALFQQITDELQSNDLTQARGTLAAFDKLESRDTELLYRLGLTLFNHNLKREAEAEFLRAASLLETGRAPQGRVKLSSVYLQIGRIRFARHDYAGTLRAVDRVQMEDLPVAIQAAVLDWKGVALLSLGRIAEARAPEQAAVAKQPNEARYLLHLAWVELLSGNIDSAQAAWEKAKILQPSSPELDQIEAFIRREKTPGRARVPYSEAWHIKGEGLICCPCDVPCPCRSNAPPTHGHCENTGAFHITQGRYGTARLDGLTFVAAGGSMEPESVPSVLYVDQTSTDEQLVALERLFQSFTPNRPLIFVQFRREPISFAQSGDEYEVSIPGLLQMHIQRQLNSAHQPLYRTAALDYFSNVIEYARNLTYKVSDARAGFEWDYSGRQSNYRQFDVGAEDYRAGHMLVQFADFSGDFNREQRALIQELKLPLLRVKPKMGE